MRELVLTSRFERAYKRLVKKDPALGEQIDSVAHDCRIVFAPQRKSKAGAEVLLLINIGSHEEVY